MPKKATKGKNKEKKSKGRVAKRLPWRKIVIALIIFITGIFYFWLRYDGLYVLKDVFKNYFAEKEITVNLYFADPGSNYLMSERRKLPKLFTQIT